MSIQETVKKLGPLHGGLWHTTHPERFLRIMESGSILPEPNIPDDERWGTGGGADFYPFVRHIGGVSLFDFQDFDYEEYDRACPLSSWREFVPFRQQWRASVWIEVDRKIAAEATISPADIKIRIDRENAWKHRWMPRIEAAHIGPIGRHAFRRVLFIGELERKFHGFDAQAFDASGFDVLLHEWIAEGKHTQIGGG